MTLHDSGISDRAKKRRKAARQGSGAPPKPLAASLLLFVPLSVLAWFGWSELGRQDQLASSALRSQAQVSIVATSRALREAAEQLLDLGLQPLYETEPTHLLDLARRCSEQDARLHHPVVLDDDAGLLFPIGATDDLGDLPFLEDPSSNSVRVAERLEALGDAPGAVEFYEQAIVVTKRDEEVEQRRNRWRADQRNRTLNRARMALGGLYRQAGKLREARSHYEQVASLATLDLGPNVSSRVGERRVTGLLATLALGELDAGTEGDGRALATLLADLAHGVHDDLPRGLVDAIDRRLRHTLSAHPDYETLLAETAALRMVGRAGHAFADAYEGLLNEAVRRRLRDADSGAERIEVVDLDASSRTLLMLERARPAATPNLATQCPDAAWHGVRIDLDLLMESVVETAPGDPTFRVTLFDPATEPDWDEIERESEATTAPGPFGTVLLARPIDPAAALEARRRRGTRRALFVLVLLAAAGGGATLLLRSVARESELLRTRVGLVSRVSHELRTPLALIRMYAETIGKGRVSEPEQRAHFTGVIVRETDGMTRLVERILDFSAKETGNLRYSPQQLDVSARVTETLSAYEPHVAHRGATLAADVDDSLWSNLDPGGLDNALVNLIENAVKYSSDDANPAPVEVRLHAAGEDRIHLEVADRGIGIPAEERERVFRGFHRASNAGEIRGAGLGLSLVAHYCTAHGGSVQALGRDGGGTVIRLELPRIKPPS